MLTKDWQISTCIVCKLQVLPILTDLLFSFVRLNLHQGGAENNGMILLLVAKDLETKLIIFFVHKKDNQLRRA